MRRLFRYMELIKNNGEMLATERHQVSSLIQHLTECSAREQVVGAVNLHSAVLALDAALVEEGVANELRLANAGDARHHNVAVCLKHITLKA